MVDGKQWVTHGGEFGGGGGFQRGWAGNMREYVCVSVCVTVEILAIFFTHWGNRWQMK